MKCAFIYDVKRKNSKVYKKIKMIEEKLRESFSEVVIYPSKSIEEFCLFFREQSQNFDYVIITGGDGTFNLMANEVARLEHKPIIGYIASGTVCDNMRKFRLTRNIKKALEIITTQNSKPVDVLKVNDYYCTYAFAKGKFVKISYATHSILKRVIGKFAYYFSSMKELFTINRIRLELKGDGIEEKKVYSLVLITNSNYVAGLKIRKKPSEDDFQLYLFEKSFLHVLRFFIFGDKVVKRSRKIRKYNLEELTVIAGKNKDHEWSNDGEKIIEKDFTVKVEKNCFRLLVPIQED